VTNVLVMTKAILSVLLCSYPSASLACAVAGKFQLADIFKADVVFSGRIGESHNIVTEVTLPSFAGTDFQGRLRTTPSRKSKRYWSTLTVAVDEIYSNNATFSMNLVGVPEGIYRSDYSPINQKYLIAAESPIVRSSRFKAQYGMEPPDKVNIPMVLYEHCTGHFIMPLDAPEANEFIGLIMFIRRLRFCVYPQLIFHPERCT
jgi:hypothetical protein